LCLKDTSAKNLTEIGFYGADVALNEGQNSVPKYIVYRAYSPVDSWMKKDLSHTQRYQNEVIRIASMSNYVNYFFSELLGFNEVERIARTVPYVTAMSKEDVSNYAGCPLNNLIQYQLFAEILRVISFEPVLHDEIFLSSVRNTYKDFVNWRIATGQPKIFITASSKNKSSSKQFFRYEKLCTERFKTILPEYKSVCAIDTASILKGLTSDRLAAHLFHTKCIRESFAKSIEHMEAPILDCIHQLSMKDTENYIEIDFSFTQDNSENHQ
jgi:hypothetical protein